MRRVLRDARVTWTTAAVYLATALFCIGIVFSMPVTDLTRTYGGTASVFSLAAGTDNLSPHGRVVFLDLTWMLFGLMAISTLSLWYEIMRLARRTEWKSIDHAAGDGAFLAGATLREPLGTSVTRPAEIRGRRRR